MTKSSFGKQVAEDTDRAGKGILPPILVNTYGTEPPQAAVFNRGVSDREGCQEAQDKMRNVQPGDYYRSAGDI